VRCKLSTNLNAQLDGTEPIFRKVQSALGRNTKFLRAKETRAVLWSAKVPTSVGICAVLSVLEEESAQCGTRCRLFSPIFQNLKVGSLKASATMPSADCTVYF